MGLLGDFLAGDLHFEFSALEGVLGESCLDGDFSPALSGDACSVVIGDVRGDWDFFLPRTGVWVTDLCVLDATSAAPLLLPSDAPLQSPSPCWSPLHSPHHQTRYHLPHRPPLSLRHRPTAMLL